MAVPPKPKARKAPKTTKQIALKPNINGSRESIRIARAEVKRKNKRAVTTTKTLVQQCSKSQKLAHEEKEPVKETSSPAKKDRPKKAATLRRSPRKSGKEDRKEKTAVSVDEVEEKPTSSCKIKKRKREILNLDEMAKSRGSDMTEKKLFNLTRELYDAEQEEKTKEAIIEWNRCLDADVVDLHYLRVAFALSYVARRILKCCVNEGKIVHVVTGRGIHSKASDSSTAKQKGDCAVIKPAVALLLKGLSLEYSFLENNEGCLRITLPEDAVTRDILILKLAYHIVPKLSGLEFVIRELKAANMLKPLLDAVTKSKGGKRVKKSKVAKALVEPVVIAMT